MSIDELCSSLYDLDICAPQGTVFAPLHFLIFIKASHKACKSLESIHYADDTTAFRTGDDIALTLNSINDDLEHIQLLHTVPCHL